MKPTQILLTFVDKETADFVRNRIAGKGDMLEDYIIANMELDSDLDCEGPDFTPADCNRCEYVDVCQRDDIGEA